MQTLKNTKLDLYELPNELWAYVLERLDFRSQVTARLVCKVFKCLVDALQVKKLPHGPSGQGVIKDIYVWKLLTGKTKLYCQYVNLIPLSFKNQKVRMVRDGDGQQKLEVSSWRKKKKLWQGEYNQPLNEKTYPKNSNIQLPHGFYLVRDSKNSKKYTLYNTKGDSYPSFKRNFFYKATVLKLENSFWLIIASKKETVYSLINKKRHTCLSLPS